MSAATLPVANSYAALSAGNALHRNLRSPGRQRPQAFVDAFDAKTLFYDCFWSVDGRRVLLAGPPPYGLDYKSAVFTARPSGTHLTPRFYPSLSTMITALPAPEGTTAVDVEIAGEMFSLPVQPNSSAALAGKRLLFGINKNNDPAWLREWAEWHVRLHGTDAIVLFDNGSSRYSTAEIQETLAGVPGLTHIAVPSWPQKFGAVDPVLLANPYWAHFLQISSMSVVLRRYGERAFGIINADIDELAGTRSGTSLYDVAHVSSGGLVVFRGTWVEAAGAGTRHRDFTQHLSDPKAAHSAQRKWALDPSRSWVRRLSVQPYWHWIEGRAWFSKSMPEDALYWHFKAINTNWKQARTAPPDGALVRDELLVQRFAQLEASP